MCIYFPVLHVPALYASLPYVRWNVPIPVIIITPLDFFIL
jgi:hypothetical protein